tara:strand:+ start:1530 stop:1982 length:453 start_codon:yes stop_codon:yes gene_type:complete
MYFEMLLKNVDSKLIPKQADQDWLQSNKQMESCKDMEEDKSLEVSMFEPERKKKKKKVLLDKDIFVSNENESKNKMSNKTIDAKKTKPKPTSKKTLGRNNGKTGKITKSQANNFSKLQESNNKITAHHGSRKEKLDKHIAKLSRGNRPHK